MGHIEVSDICDKNGIFVNLLHPPISLNGEQSLKKVRA